MYPRAISAGASYVHADIAMSSFTRRGVLCAAASRPTEVHVADFHGVCVVDWLHRHGVVLLLRSGAAVTCPTGVVLGGSRISQSRLPAPMVRSETLAFRVSLCRVEACILWCCFRPSGWLPLGRRVQASCVDHGKAIAGSLSAHVLSGCPLVGIPGFVWIAGGRSGE